jgi:SdrD B-like domain
MAWCIRLLVSGSLVVAPTAVTPALNITYFIIGANSNGCKDTAQVVVTVKQNCLSLGNLVWNDANNNGLKDVTEIGIPNIQLAIFNIGLDKQKNTADDIAAGTATTDANGKYLFPNLTAGVYFVKITGGLQAGQTSSTGTGTNNFSPTGQYEPGAPTDNNIDNNDDGTMMAGTPPMIMSDTIRLKFFDEPVTDGDSDRNSNLTVDFGLYTPKFASIGNFVWKDTNDNGKQDAGEIGVPNIKVELYTVDFSGNIGVNPLKIKYTNASGIYLFDSLQTGIYKVRFVTTSFPISCKLSNKKDVAVDSLDSDPAPDGLTSTITVSKDSTGIKKDNMTVDAALIFNKYASLGNRVWYDTNNNGIQDAGEAPVPNVKVELYVADNSGNPAATPLKTIFTNASGLYLFDSLATGKYKVKFLLTTFPTNYILTPKKDIGLDSLDSDPAPDGFSPVITLNTDSLGLKKDNMTVDAGVIILKGSLGDFVWNDTNNNGIQDETMPNSGGVPNVIIELYKNGVYFAKDTTDATGKYLFTGLELGTYFVKIVQTSLPVGYIPSLKQDIGTDDTKDSDTDATGKSGNYVIDPIDPTKQNILTVDAAIYAPKGSLGDFVWKDTNNNGKQDETTLNGGGVAGIILELYKNGIATGIQTTTDATGKYLFAIADSAAYQVKIIASSIPATCRLSTQQNIGADNLDNDFNATTGLSDAVTVVPTNPALRDILTVDAALVIRPTLTITDPCSCFKVEYEVLEKKELYEELTITSSPNEVWRIIQQSGMLKLDTFVKIAFPVPTTLVETAAGIYRIPYTVENNLQYTVTATNGIDTLKYNNTCIGKYPSNLVVTTLDTVICKNAAPITLTASSNIPGTTQFFYVNKATGQRINITQFDPSLFNSGDTIYVKMALVPTDITKCRTTIVQPIKVTTANCCTLPTLGTTTPTLGTCTNNVINNDAKIDFTGIINANKAAVSEGATYTDATYATATNTVTGGAVSFAGLKHNTQYTFRIFNQYNTCFKDITVTTPTKVCTCLSPVNAGTAVANPIILCQTATGLAPIDLLGQLNNEDTGGTWVQTGGVLVGGKLNAVSGSLNPNGLAVGSYTFRYTVTGTAPCPNATADVTVGIQQCCPPTIICLPMTITKH